jgi:ribonuclease HI
MRIEAFLAARVEVLFVLWGALIQIDGSVTWSSANVVGRTPHFTVPQAQYVGAVETLKRLHALWEKDPDASLTMVTDSKALVEELNGEWRRSQCEASAILHHGIDLVESLGTALTLRYCARNANLAAHELITQLCKRHRVPVQERFVRR